MSLTESARAAYYHSNKPLPGDRKMHTYRRFWGRRMGGIFCGFSAVRCRRRGVRRLRADCRRRARGFNHRARSAAGHHPTTRDQSHRRSRCRRKTRATRRRCRIHFLDFRRRRAGQVYPHTRRRSGRVSSPQSADQPHAAQYRFARRHRPRRRRGFVFHRAPDTAPLFRSRRSIPACMFIIARPRRSECTSPTECMG